MIIGWYNKKMGGKILAYCLLICMVFSSFMVMPSPVTAAESWENNGIGLSELVPENVVVFAGNAMDESKMGFLKNFYYLTEDDLDDLRDATSGGLEAYTHFGVEAWISDTLYSSSDDHGIPEWRYNCFSGIDLEAAFNGLGVATTSSTSLRVKSTDGYSQTLQNAFDQTRYYFNPQGVQSTETVTPILALKRSVASTLDAPSPESTLEVPVTAAADYAPLFAYGQQTANEDNNCKFVKTVNSVVAGTENVALTVKQDGESDKQMSISEIIRQGVYKTEYTFKSSGSADFRTHEVTGIPLTRLLTAMGVSVGSGQGIQPTTSDSYPTSAIARADMDKWFVAYDAKENGSQVENHTALRLYGPGQFGNQMIVKHLKELTVTGEVTIDKSALYSAISAANTKHDNAAEGTETGQYAAGSKAIFKAAIEDAQEVADDSAAIQAEVDQAIIDLAAAEALFDAAKITGGKEEGGDAANAVFYIAVKESADSATKYYYYTRAELEACATTQDYLYNDHSVIKTVTARGALLSALLADLDGVTITDDMIIQYAEADGYHADQNTAIENSSYKDKVSWLTTSHFDSFTKEAARTTITYEIHEEYLSPDENNVNDPPGFFKDADKDSGYLRAYRETGSGQNDANIGGANATVIKYLMGVVVSYNGALFSGKDGYTLKAVSAKNPDLSIIADQKVTGLVPGMEYAVQAPSVVNAVLASGESPYQMITVGTGATQTITFKYTENPYFYVTKGSDTVNYTYTDLVKSSVQMPDKDDNTAPYGYSRPMYYRYNGKWLADLIGTEIMNNSTVTGFTIIAKDGTKTEISKEEVADYFVAYNNTQSKTSTNIPEGKRVTETYEDARIIIPGEGENITGSSSTDYTSAGKDVGVLVAEAEGIVAKTGATGGKEEGGDAANAVFYIAVKESADSATKYYYYTRAELEACATTQDYLYNDHSVIKTVTARGALLSALLADLDGVTITDDMIIQYAEADGYHADQNTAIENSSYKDKVSWLTTSHFDSFTKEAARTTITYEIHEEYLSPDENNVNDPPGFFKDADKDSGYLRAYRETGSGQNDANIGGANATVIKYLMGVVVSYNGALFSGKDGYTLKAVSAKNPDLSIIADQKVTGLVPGMEYAVQAPSVVNAVLASGESPYQMITVGTGATQTITFKYTENPYFYVTKGSDTVNYTYTDLVKSSVQMPDKDDNTAPYGYSRPMYYRYNGKWLADLIGTEIMNNSTVTGFTIIAKDGTKTEISKEEVADYFVAYNNTQSKTSTNIPEGKRVTETYEDARIIIPGEGENITGSLSDDYTSAGKDVGVLVAEAEGIVAIVKSSGSPGGGGGGGVVTPTVNSVKIKTAPDKVVYDEGDALKLAGLEITLTYSDETTKDVAYADFAGYDITVSPKNGDLLKAEDAEILIAVNSKTAKQTITVNARKVTAVAPPQAEQAGLKDVSGHWAAASIDEMIEKGIVSGYPDGTFKPEQPITRAEFTVMLVKAFNLPAEGNKVFDDTAGHWAQGFIAAASDAGIVSGISVGEFAPDALITREQMAVMIVNAAKIATSDEELTLIDQNSISAWARNAVASAVSAELIFGYPDQTFRPQDNASRAEAVSVIARALDTRQ